MNNPCFDCQFYENCGKDASMRNYKFGRTTCHAYKYDRFDPDIDIKRDMRERDLRKHIEWLIDNRVDRRLW